MGSSLNLRFKSVSFRYRNDPNHNNSDFVIDWFTRNSEQFPNWASKLKGLFSDWTSPRKTVLSSGYCVSFTVFVSSISMPFISFVLLMALARISIPIVNRIPDRGQLCLTSLPKLNCLVAKPLFRMQLEMSSLCITLIHCRSWGPKLKVSRHFWS